MQLQVLNQSHTTADKMYEACLSQKQTRALACKHSVQLPWPSHTPSCQVTSAGAASVRLLHYCNLILQPCPCSRQKTGGPSARSSYTTNCAFWQLQPSPCRAKACGSQTSGPTCCLGPRPAASSWRDILTLPAIASRALYSCAIMVGCTVTLAGVACLPCLHLSALCWSSVPLGSDDAYDAHCAGHMK